jgi:8-oxo-dGTP pyrophosphatase MutT (NUDIX family)
MIVLNKWLKDSPSKLPTFSTHNLGVGGIVLSPCKSKLLLIKENHAVLKNMWKFPGGLVDQGERLEEAVVREVWEETGIESDYLGVLGFREQLNFRFE